MRPTMVVVGGGFKGIVTAKHLADRGYKVVLIESGKNLGGIHFSIPWDGFQLDLGCHVFSNENDQTTKLLFDLLGQAPSGVTPVVKSVYQNKHSDGLEYPDFTSMPNKLHADYLFNLMNHVAHCQDEVLAEPSLDTSLESFFQNRYGEQVTRLLEDALKKILRTDLKNISSSAFSAIPAKRVSLAEPLLAGLLKQMPYLDELILNPSPDDPMRYMRKNVKNYDHRSFYPVKGGMGAFSKNAKQHLIDIGVQIKIESTISKIESNSNGLTLQLSDSENIECTDLFWTSGAQTLANVIGLDIDVSTNIHNIPMVLFYFDVPIDDVGPYTWVQDFDDNHLIYRASPPSMFGQGTAPKNRAYVLAEVLTDIDSDIYLNAEAYTNKVWDEMVELGVCSGALPEHRKIMKTPVSYKFPKADFHHQKAILEGYLIGEENVHLFDEWVFGKAASVNEIQDYLNEKSY